MFFISTNTITDGVYFDVKKANNHLIFKSIKHNSQKQCTNAIDSFKINSSMDKRFIRKQSKDTYYFSLKAGNGKIIGQSKNYSDNYEMEQDIRALQNNPIQKK